MFYKFYIHTLQDGLPKLIKSVHSKNTILRFGWEMENTRLDLASSKMSNGNEHNTKRDRAQMFRPEDKPRKT